MNLKAREIEMQTFFDKVANINYDEEHLKVLDNKKKILEFLNEDTKIVLDLGCGTGLELIGLFKKYPSVSVIAIDLSKEMTDILKKRNLSKNLTIVNDSYFNYDFGIDRFDAVISTQSLHHFEVEDKIKLYTKVYESLKDNGVFINEDYFANTDLEEKQKFEEYYNKSRGEGKHYDTPLTVKHEIEVLKSAGFSNIETNITDDCKIVIARKSNKKRNTLT